MPSFRPTSRVQPASQILGGPTLAVDGAGRVYLGSYDGMVRAISPEGKKHKQLVRRWLPLRRSPERLPRSERQAHRQCDQDCYAVAALFSRQ
jgi:hypothetical protein